MCDWLAIRFNLDPAGDSADEELWKALKAVAMANTEGRIGRVQSLDDRVEAGAQNYSAGESKSSFTP